MPSYWTCPYIDEGQGLYEPDKLASYIIRKTGSVYEAINGSTSKMDYGGSDDVGGVDGADAATVIQAAIDVLSSGGKIFIKDGLYSLSATPEVSNAKIVIDGESWNTILTIDNGVNDSVIRSTADYCSIRNLQVDGNRAGQTGGYPKGIEVDANADYATIENCYVYDTWDEGIFVKGPSTGDIISSCLVDTSGQSNISLYGNASGTVDFSIVSNCVTKNSGVRVVGNNLYFKDTTYCVASNIVGDTSSDENFGLQAWHQTCRGNVFSGLTGKDATLTGIHLEGTDATHKCLDTVLTGFHINNCGSGGQSGLLIDTYVERATVSNGVLNDCNAYGIMIDSNATDLTIDSVIIENTVDDGVWVVDSSNSNITLSKLTILNAGDVGIYVVNALNTLISECRVEGSADDGIFVYLGSKSVCVNNTVIGTQNRGILIYQSNNAVVDGNRVEGSTDDQIVISDADFCAVLNNYVMDTASAKDGIYFATGADHNFANGNYIYNTTITNRTGIHMYSADNNSILNNYLYNCATGLWIENADCDKTFVNGNDFRACTTDVTDAGTGTLWGGNVKDDDTVSAWGEDLDP